MLIIEFSNMSNRYILLFRDHGQVFPIAQPGVLPVSAEAMGVTRYIGYMYLTCRHFPIHITSLRNSFLPTYRIAWMTLPGFFSRQMVTKEFAMIRYTHYSWSLPKQLEGLRKAGKKAELAAGKCAIILNDMRKYGCQSETVLCHRTRNGELRIKNCVKYDLGSGYRLVTIKVGCHLFIPFVGSHDDTDQWIEHHRYDTFAPRKLLYRCEERVVQADVAEISHSAPQVVGNRGDEYEEQLIARLDEGQLKSIFQGLFMNPSLALDKTEGVKAARGAIDRVPGSSAIR
jgi:hypothetical protein